MSDRKFEFCFIFIVLAVHLISGMQCLNYCDEVFVIASGQQFFEHPESISYYFMYYLGGFFAGIWNLVFADLGIYGFRVFNALLITLTYYISYKTIKPYVNRWYVFAGVLLAMLAETSDITMVIHHNSVTCFFTTCAACCLFKGLVKERWYFFLFAGILLGINVFSRLTNIALVGLILSLIPYYIYKNKDNKFLFNSICYSVLGFFIGLAVVVAVMSFLGHLDLFIDVIKMLVSVSQDPLSTHGFLLLLPRYLKDYAYIIVIGGYLIMVLFVDNRVERNHKINKILSLIIAIILSLPVYRFGLLHIYYSIMTICFLYVISHNKNSQAVVYLSVIALLIIYLQPLGGDFGIVNMHSCSIRFAMPLCLGLLGIIINENKEKIFLKYFVFSFLLALFIKGGYNVVLHRAWYDATPRWEYTTMPKTKKANVFLKEKYANLLDDVMCNLDKYSTGYNTLFVIGYMPLFNYLSGIPPYLQCCTPDFYSPLMLEEQIKRAEVYHSNDLPIVIRCLGKRPAVEDYDPDWNNPKSMESAEEKKFVLYQDFLERHNYKEVWRKESFAIMLPINEYRKNDKQY